VPPHRAATAIQLSTRGTVESDLWFSRLVERPVLRRYVCGITAERLLSRNLCWKAARNPIRLRKEPGVLSLPSGQSLSNRLLSA